jgi:hypothetical protein
MKVSIFGQHNQIKIFGPQCLYTLPSVATLIFEKKSQKNANKGKIYISIIIIIQVSESAMAQMDSPWTQYMNNNRVNHEFYLFLISSGSIFAFC